jgi:hypothetical protein
MEAPVRVFKAEPVRTMSFAPGRQQVVVVSRPGHAARLVEPAEVLRVAGTGWLTVTGKETRHGAH